MKYLIHSRNNTGAVIEVPSDTTAAGYGEMQQEFQTEHGPVANWVGHQFADMIRLSEYA